MASPRLRVSRRALLAGLAVGLGAGPAFAASKRHKTKSAAKEPVPDPAADGTPLAFPPVVDLKDGETCDLVAAPADHAFLAGHPVPVVGYGGTYMGPVLRVRRGTRTRVRLVNRLDRPTNVHWHGLLVEGRFDGGTTPPVAPGGTWEADLAVDQPAATLWYHAHVHGRTAQDVHDGLAGLLLVEDDVSAGLGLPATWGVDDLPLVLQDRALDAGGRPTYVETAAVMNHGFRGPDMVVNGIAHAVAEVPGRLVRLRLLNAAGARTFRLFFEDRRPFRLIATDGGLLAEPSELSVLVMAPGERAEILVDFAEGAGVLLTAPDEHEHRDGPKAMLLPDVVDRPTRVLAFRTVRDERPTAVLPARLVDLPPLPTAAATAELRQRRFELRMTGASPAPTAPAAHDLHVMGHAGMTRGPGGVGELAEPPPIGTINGRTFASGRIDETVRLGTSEIWEIVCPDMAHPFHAHGVHFRVLSEDGDLPKAWNRGVKDTVRVENSARLLITFTRPADAERPFVYHCHLLEHEDAGMMGAFTVA